MLEINKFNKIIAANWKLNGSYDFVQSYFDTLKATKVKEDTCIILCPPLVYLHKCIEFNQFFYFGAQDCSNFKKGPYTGDISASMLKNCHCDFSLVGHSERRQIFNQTNQDIKIKTNNLLDEGLNPIICIGETLDDKKKGKTKEHLTNQITQSLPKNPSDRSIIIAYEPIWAIGTGLTPTLEEIEDIHTFIKKDIKDYENCKLLYGGSVKADNAKKIMDLNNVDGVLVGGSSLNPVEFLEIINS